MASNRAQVYHNLSVMLDAGMPTPRSLRTVASGARGPLAGGLSAVVEAVSAGHGVAETMAKHPKVFAPLELALVEVGETSGNLPECLRCLSRWYEFRDRLRRTITSAALLPVLIFHAAAVIGPLPALFLSRIGTAGYVLQVAAVLAALYVPAGAILAVVRLTPPRGRLCRLLDAFTLRIPLLGQAVLQLALSRYCRVFHVLYGSGMPIVRAAEMAAGAAGNAAVANLLDRGTASARAGYPLSDGFGRELPRQFRDAWRIGEQAGALEEVARRLADGAAEASQRIFSALGVWLPRLFYLLVCILLVWQILSAYGMIRV